MDRTPGRYNLHKLGWKAFEDLAIEINRTVLGATVTTFRIGADGGRDGFFKGSISGEYATLAPTASTAVFQCKHSSTSGESLKWADVKDELPKVTALAATGEADLFVVMTNRRIGAEDERIIRGHFESVPGIQRTAILGEEWIESHIDGNFRLLRRVPRLFGVGDLSQILSHSVSQQTRLILDEMQLEQATFVPTDSYRNAIDAIEQHRIVVLVGPPASGKSAIALNICVVLGAEHEDLEVLKIETAEQFKSMWSAQDSRKLFWVDDFLGETTLDHDRVQPWMAAMEKVRTAQKNGNFLLFTSRDYILNDADGRVRKAKLDFFKDHSVFVRVDNLAASERERILYNHVKLGDLNRDAKRALKPQLPNLAKHPSLTPEIARRFGTIRFHKGLQPYSQDKLLSFIDRPMHFFSEVIQDLGSAEKATIAYLLLFNNSLPDPVSQVPEPIKAAYGIDVADLRRALESMNKNLVKLSIIGRNRVWQVHHPSMIDAMHQHLGEHPTMLDLFVAAAPVEVVLRDCGTTDISRLFVPESMFHRLLERVLSASPVAAIKYLESASADFIQFAIRTEPLRLAQAMGRAFESGAEHWGVRLLAKVKEDLGESFELGKTTVEDTLQEAFWESWCSEALIHEDFESPLDLEIRRECVREYENNLSSTFESMERRARNQASASDAGDILDIMEVFFSRLQDAAAELLSPDENGRFSTRSRYEYESSRREVREFVEFMDHEEDVRYTYWKEHGRYERVKDDAGIFSDVDE